MCVCVLFIAGATSRSTPNQRCALVEVVGPTGLADRQGWSVGLPGPPTAPTSWSGLVLVSPCPKVEAWPAPAGFASVLGLHLVHLSLNQYSDIFCDFVLGQSVLVTSIA